jgi:hypothetical protein
LNPRFSRGFFTLWNPELVPEIISDDPPWVAGYPPPVGFVQPSISAQLQKDFNDDQADFYVHQGNPCAVWGMLDYAIDYGVYPTKEIHPFGPVFNGEKISRAKFYELVTHRHGLSNVRFIASIAHRLR